MAGNSSYDNRPIGVFDSGLGGLTVAAALMRRLPHEKIVYLGDNARVPYGNKSQELIRQFAVQDVAFLAECDVKMCIAACNTVSAVALDTIRAAYPAIPLSGVIVPGSRSAVASGARSVAVIATRATTASGAYENTLRSMSPEIEVRSMATPLLVPLAEEGVLRGDVVRGVFELYLGEMRKNPPDALLLGCTHYPLFKQSLTEYFSGRTRVIDSAECCADFAAEYLTAHGMEHVPEGDGAHEFFVTDLPEVFHLHAERFLGRRISNPHLVTLNMQL